jgi:beta-N-acetylhexosaminidase
LGIFAFVIFSACNSAQENEIILPTPTPTSTSTPTSTPEVNFQSENLESEIFENEEIFLPEIIPHENNFSAISCPVEIQLSRMSVEEKIGQLFILRLPWQTLYVNEAVENLFETIAPGGIILFSDNAGTAQQIQGLTAQLQEISCVPLFIAVDEEGGRVSRVGRFFSNGAASSAYEIGQSLYPDALAFETGIYIAHELAILGINMNFAPVADIWSNPENTVIGNRAFGQNANAVAPLVEAMVNGLREGGIMPVIKHFPGHGDTYEDSHYQLAIFRSNFESWLNNERIPFESGINANAHGVMTGHIATPQINDSGNLPATFSTYWHDILRNELGFDGLIITDALEMRALTNNFSCGEIALNAFLAGADILLMPLNHAEAFQALLHAFETGIFDEERLNDSVRRILRAKNEFFI